MCTHIRRCVGVYILIYCAAPRGMLYKGEGRRGRNRVEESGEEGDERGNSGARCHAALCSSGVEHTRTVVYVRRSVGRSFGRLIGRSLVGSVGWFSSVYI